MSGEALLGSEVMARAERQVTTIVALAKASKLRVAAFGVRSLTQIRQLRRLGVDLASGPVIAPGLSGGSFLALMVRLGRGVEARQGEKPRAA